MRCPICDKQFEPETSPAMPFCSQRCRLIDLGRWLDEKQGLPFEPAEKEKEADSGQSAAGSGREEENDPPLDTGRS